MASKSVTGSGGGITYSTTAGTLSIAGPMGATGPMGMKGDKGDPGPMPKLIKSGNGIGLENPETHAIESWVPLDNHLFNTYSPPSIDLQQVQGLQDLISKQKEMIEKLEARVKALEEWTQI